MAELLAGARDELLATDELLNSWLLELTATAEDLELTAMTDDAVCATLLDEVCELALQPAKPMATQRAALTFKGGNCLNIQCHLKFEGAPRSRQLSCLPQGIG